MFKTVAASFRGERSGIGKPFENKQTKRQVLIKRTCLVDYGCNGWLLHQYFLHCAVAHLDDVEALGQLWLACAVDTVNLRDLGICRAADFVDACSGVDEVLSSRDCSLELGLSAILLLLVSVVVVALQRVVDLFYDSICQLAVSLGIALGLVEEVNVLRVSFLLDIGDKEPVVRVALDRKSVV